MNKTITVVIPALNEERKIVNCLLAVMGQSYQPLEILVVDGGSTDDTVVFTHSCSTARVINNPYVIRAGACKLGIEQAQGDYVAFTDADCVPEKDWLKNFVDNLDGVVGLAGNTKYELGTDIWVRSINLSLKSLLGSGDSIQYRSYPTKRKVKNPSGCNAIYLKQAVIDAGGFNVGLSGGEDEDLNRRLKGDIYYIPEAVVWHDHKMKGLKQYANRMFKYGKWKIENNSMFFRTIPPSLFAPLVLISLIWAPWVFVSFAVAYLAIVLWSSYNISVEQDNHVYLFTLPIVYFIGHVSYTWGFWTEILRKLFKR